MNIIRRNADLCILTLDILEKIFTHFYQKKTDKGAFYLFELEQFGYLMYAVQVINSNYDTARYVWMDKYNYPINIADLSEIYGIQLAMLEINGQVCFDQVAVKARNHDYKVLITMSPYFKRVISFCEKIYEYDELVHQYKQIKYGSDQ